MLYTLFQHHWRTATGSKMYGSPFIVTGNVIFSAHCLVSGSVAGKILFRITDFGQSDIGTSEYRIEGRVWHCIGYRIKQFTDICYPNLWISMSAFVSVNMDSDMDMNLDMESGAGCGCGRGRGHGHGHGYWHGHRNAHSLKKLLISDIRLFLYWISLILELTKKSKSFLVR